MIKLLILFAVIAVASTMGSENAPGLEGREDAPQVASVSDDAQTFSGTTDTQEDMDKAETFGFGYRKIIHVYPHYYPRYYYGGYYPRYYYGHYGHYW
ncbi:cuticle protein 14-like [Anopheles ziemanni]|uniref:cuticle protein 14-like n=1 Tax=Anopheles coustani TaxID=139045 RepID=UPI002657DAEC|nr:cuticle protein 14-like [Anopheles coustani]XP_058178223.1 cuticle protein 14-like [Anopheles ziemanni]